MLDTIPGAAVLVQVVRPYGADPPHVLARDYHCRQRARLHAEAERIHCGTDAHERVSLLAPIRVGGAGQS